MAKFLKPFLKVFLGEQFIKIVSSSLNLLFSNILDFFSQEIRLTGDLDDFQTTLSSFYPNKKKLIVHDHRGVTHSNAVFLNSPMFFKHEKILFVFYTKSSIEKIHSASSPEVKEVKKEEYFIRYFSNDSKAFDSLIKKIQESSSDNVQTDEGIVSLRFLRFSKGNFSAYYISKKIKPFDLIKSNSKEILYKDMFNFFNSEEDYRKTGSSYKRGALVYGPPGTGKTSIISSIAQKLNKKLVVINLDPRNMDGSNLRTVFCNWSNCIILVEDVNKNSFSKEIPSDKLTFEGYTFSELLNTMDGLDSGEGNYIIFTTNFPEEIPPAVIRSGRIDLKIEFSYAKKNEIIQLYELFYPTDSLIQAEEYADAVLAHYNNKITMSDIQSHFQKNFYSSDNLIESISDIICTFDSYSY